MYSVARRGFVLGSLAARRPKRYCGVYVSEGVSEGDYGAAEQSAQVLDHGAKVTKVHL